MRMTQLATFALGLAALGCQGGLVGASAIPPERVDAAVGLASAAPGSGSSVREASVESATSGVADEVSDEVSDEGSDEVSDAAATEHPRVALGPAVVFLRTGPVLGVQAREPLAARQLGGPTTVGPAPSSAAPAGSFVAVGVAEQPRPSFPEPRAAAVVTQRPLKALTDAALGREGSAGGVSGTRFDIEPLDCASQAYPQVSTFPGSNFLGGAVPGRPEAFPPGVR